ncbi:MAG TPA: hypothetical protein EYG18_06840 [Micavibrio sp.]|nr:hypothetical protein [Micavibrio sp.]HIL28968.1 hypothetical protein [Micavibrio sp.]
MLEIIAANLYATFGLISTSAYWIQIRRLQKIRTTQHEISIKTWSIWSVQSMVALFYGVVCLQDLLFCMLTILNMSLIMTVICMVMRNRYVFSGQAPSVIVAAFRYYLCRPFFDVASIPIEVPVKTRSQR